MREYRGAYRDFSVQQLAREVLHGSLADGVNAAIECCDRWAEDGRTALDWIGKNFNEEAFTFASLRDKSARFANLLRARGIGQGDVVGGLLPRIPELLAVALGTWRVGAIYQPLFTAFGHREPGHLGQRKSCQAHRDRRRQPSEARGARGVSARARGRKRVLRRAQRSIL
jgi:acetyl-CoA synthetase